MRTYYSHHTKKLFKHQLDTAKHIYTTRALHILHLHPYTKLLYTSKTLFVMPAQKIGNTPTLVRPCEQICLLNNSIGFVNMNLCD